MRTLAFLWVMAGVASAGVDRFVDPVSGDDVSTECNAALPCKTITRTLLAAQPGDRVLASPGTYGSANGEVFPLRLPVGVRLSGVGGRAATFLIDDDASASSGETVLASFDGAMLATGIEGFTIDGQGLAENRYGVWLESLTTDPGAVGTEPFVRDCRVTGFARAGVGVATWGFGAPLAENRMQALLDGNEILASGTGIYVITISEDGVTRARDTSTLRNNLIVGCGNGIELTAAIMTAATGTGRLETSLRHNTILGATGDAVVLSAPDALAMSDGVLIDLANNIFAGSVGYGVRELAGHDFADSRVLIANAFNGNRLGGYRDSGGGVYTTAIELNNLPDGVTTHGNRDDDPRVDGTSGRLDLASPCRDRGDAAYSTADDFDRQFRPTGVLSDIGADEVVPLRRYEFLAITPLLPPAATVFPVLPEWRNAPPSPWVDPVVTAPLTVYRLAEGGPSLVLYAVKAGSGVTLYY